MTSSEVAVPVQGVPDLGGTGVDLYASLERWAAAATAAHRMAEKLVVTSFVPEAYRGRPHEATAAILAGAEMGLSPMASLKAFDVINGVAAPRAITLRAIVQSRGHRMWEVEVTDERVVVQGQRKGESVIHESVWTLERARALKLTDKDNWRKQPRAMLLARATAECARMTAADAILGIAYSAEEIADGERPPGSPVRVEAKAGTPVRVTAADILGDGAPSSADQAVPPTPADQVASQPPQAPAQQPAAELATVDADGQAVIDVGDAQPMISPEQSQELHGLARAQGRNTKARLGPIIREVTGRDVSDTKELTADEAARVIARLKADAAAAERAAAEGTA